MKIEDELEVDRSCLSAVSYLTGIIAYQRAGLDTVFASLDSGQSMVSVRVTMSVELRPAISTSLATMMQLTT